MLLAWQIRVRGLVQGVGFRPFVWRLAKAAGLRGEVWNDAQGVIIRLAGRPRQLAAFKAQLQKNTPPLARIDALEVTALEAPPDWPDFSIAASLTGQISTGITPDAATCADCLADINTSENRRFGYAFTNCTNCGPRLSITRAIPYDRANTSMAAFRMCAACQAEYDDPADRRFHAQPNACADCGPQLWVVDKQGRKLAGAAISIIGQALKAGRIVAIKGLGGFQLAVDAGNELAVAMLRSRKHRPAKPLACMARDLAMVACHARLDKTAEQVLASPQAPIVLLPVSGAPLAGGVAPRQSRLGFMLPNTPLHHLLMQQLDRPVVLTSGNLTDEPQVTGNDIALEKLTGIADLWLLHDRDIINRMDDSVVQITGGGVQILRRARGYAPAPLRLHKGFAAAPPVLAIGADLKNTFCLLKGGQAIVSQHMGDMENPETQRDFIANLALYRRIYQFAPAHIATDLHPGYFSTRLGQGIAAQAGFEASGVQHHHAHIAAVLAEHGHGPDTKPVLGVVLDGAGYGMDGHIWGGEFLLANFQGFKRLAHFNPVPLLGGEKASRQPWRNALAHLLVAFGPEALADLAGRFGPLEVFSRLAEKPSDLLTQMFTQELNAPLASSAGRLFDAVAALLGLSFDQTEFEGEAAMQLQSLAEACPQEQGEYPVIAANTITWQPLFAGILGDLQAGIAPEIIARRFHNTLAAVISRMVQKMSAQYDVDMVVLTGGVFQNSLLASATRQRIMASGHAVLCPSGFPANDGGVSLGQASIRAAGLSGKWGGRADDSAQQLLLRK